MTKSYKPKTYAPAQTLESESHVAAHEKSKSQNRRDSNFWFTDNRPEAAAQKHLRQIAHNSERGQQLQAFRQMANESQAVQFQMMEGGNANKQDFLEERDNCTVLPGVLKSGIENLSGLSMADVKVHYNSSKPAMLQAYAYAQGSDIYLGPNQEMHLPHEAWHVVQQKQGRVKQTALVNGAVSANDSLQLEAEADIMGDKATHADEDSGEAIQAFDTDAKYACGWRHSVVDQTMNSSGALPPAPVTQFTKVKFPGLRKSREESKKTADPFQLATVQFNAAYDINAYQDEISAYMLSCIGTGTIPVIEFRFYDAAFTSSIKAYHEEVTKLLDPIFDDITYDIVFSLLRDETANPGKTDDTTAQESVDEIEMWLKQATFDLDMEQDSESRGLFAQGNNVQKAAKKAALNLPKDKMLRGEMMVPAPEAFDYVGRSDEELTNIYMNKDKSVHYSLHQRLMAKLILLNRVKSASATANKSSATVSAPPKPKLARRNSTVRPNTLTLTNLVTGNEEDTQASTLQACRNAIEKGASQVYLIVEVDGYDKQRAERQIAALEEEFTVRKIGEIDAEAAGPAQQSGVKLVEPGSVKSRVKIRVMPSVSTFLSKWSHEIHPQDHDEWVENEAYHIASLTFEEYQSLWTGKWTISSQALKAAEGTIEDDVKRSLALRYAPRKFVAS